MSNVSHNAIDAVEKIRHDTTDQNEPQGHPSESRPLSWQNPPRLVRVFLVACFMIFPGLIAGLMGSFIIPYMSNPTIAATVGAAVFAIGGGWLEAAEEKTHR